MNIKEIPKILKVASINDNSVFRAFCQVLSFPLQDMTSIMD